MNVGLFGGSFNPPHLAHLIVAETVREQFGLDRIWWIPAHLPPHKTGAALAAPAHRLEMTRLAVAGNSGFDLCDLEVRRAGTSYTVDTIRALQQAHPDAAFSLIIGSDSLRAFGAWRRPDEIVALVPLIVYKRPGSFATYVEPHLAGRVRFADAPLLEISGTDIRARLHEGRSVRYLVPDAVLAYIEAHHLYQG